MLLKIILKSEAIYQSDAIYLFVTRNEVIMNPLEDLLALNICAQNFSVSEIIMAGFKIDQSTINYDP